MTKARAMARPCLSTRNDVNTLFGNDDFLYIDTSIFGAAFALEPAYSLLPRPTLISLPVVFSNSTIGRPRRQCFSLPASRSPDPPTIFRFRRCPTHWCKTKLINSSNPGLVVVSFGLLRVSLVLSPLIVYLS
jgi:hypothetical protein